MAHFGILNTHKPTHSRLRRAGPLSLQYSVFKKMRAATPFIKIIYVAGLVSFTLKSIKYKNQRVFSICKSILIFSGDLVHYTENWETASIQAYGKVELNERRNTSWGNIHALDITMVQ